MAKAYKRGFTLIELLVVIAIIGILASIILASLNSARQKSRDARRIADIKELQLALELYYDANNGQFPTAINAPNLVTPDYIPGIPTDPLNQSNYLYAALTVGSGTTCASYHLGATLENTSNPALSGDADACASSQSCANKDTAICSGSGNDFDGTAPGVYDVKP